MAVKPHPDFDGHLEYSLKDKTPTEKIEYLWQMILLKHTLEQARKDGPAVPPQSTG
jgi:hypothetical protein